MFGNTFKGIAVTILDFTKLLNQTKAYLMNAAMRYVYRLKELKQRCSH